MPLHNVKASPVFQGAELRNLRYGVEPNTSFPLN